MKYLFDKDGFEIHFEAIPETESIEDALSFASCGVDHTKTINAVNNGEYEHFVAHVVAKKNGVTLGEDYLGSCIYETIEEFTGLKGDYFEQMVDTAISNAKQCLSELCNQKTVIVS